MRLLQLNTILVADDLTATSEPALQSAAALRDGAGAALHVAHVAPPGTQMAAKGGIRAEFVASIESSIERAGVRGDYTPHVLTGSNEVAIAELADRISANVIVTGRRGRSALPMDRPLGGTAFAIITRAAVPCLAVTERLRLPLKRVLVAINSSQASRGALITALTWTSALRARDADPPTLTAVHVHADDGTTEAGRWKREVQHELDILRRAAGDWTGVEVSGTTLASDDPVKTIAAHAAASRADLVVVGTRAGVGWDPKLGSVPTGILAQVNAAVLLVPPAVWRDHAKDMDYF